jgi:hypothetical protein
MIKYNIIIWYNKKIVYIYIVYINFKFAVPMVILSSVMILLVDDDSAAYWSVLTPLQYAIHSYAML